jgi:hypothetical protein
MSDNSPDPAPPDSSPASEAPPPAAAEATRSFDRTLILATGAIALTAGLLLAGVLVIESGFEQLRKEAFPLPEKEAPERAGRAPSRDASLSPSEETERTAFLGLDLQHPLSSGIVSVYVDDRLVHEAALASQPRKVFLFRVAPQGTVRVSVPVEPGVRRVLLRIRSEELPFEPAADAVAEFREGEWRLLIARLRPDPLLLDTRWGQ